MIGYTILLLVICALLYLCVYEHQEKEKIRKILEEIKEGKDGKGN